MSRLCSRWALIAVFLALGAGACGEGPAAGPSLGGERIVDEPHGFELARPGPGWRLLNAEQASALYPDALAAAVSPEVTAVIAAERMPKVSLERYAARVVD